jgi:hypothetical protein
MTLVFEFPAPDVPMSENQSRRKHWAERKRELDPWRDWTIRRWTVLRHTPEGKALIGVPCEIQVWLPFKDRKRRDPHNYVSTCVKTIVDALVDKHEHFGKIKAKIYDGIWPDDTPEWVTIREPKLYVGEDVVVELVPRPVIAVEERPPRPT